MEDKKIQRIIDEEFLQKFVDCPSPTGSEQAAQTIYKNYLADIGSSIKTDVMGNVDVVINQNGSPKIILMGHVDEVGLMIRYINEKGFIYFNMLGGIDAHLTPGSRVKILSNKGEILGVIGKKAIHLQKPEERKKVIDLKDQFIDLGAKNREDVENMGIRIGDPIIFDTYYSRLGNNDKILSRCFDDKVGAFIVAEILKQLKNEEFDGCIHGISSTQEEIGTRGAITSSFEVDPKVGIAYDVTFASDSPDMKENERGKIELGGGPVINRGPNINPVLFDLIVETAKELEMPIQLLSNARVTGTDARSIQMTRSGVATALIGIPNRYMHSMSELVDLNDLDAIVRLSVAVIKKIKKDTSFIPK